MPELPRLAERYEIIEELGRGGFAVVYKARDTVLDRIVALKVLHPYWNEDPSFAARFRREARSAGGLRHPNVVTIFETGEFEGQLYIAMEYLPGRSLEELLDEEGALSLEEAIPILEQLANALDYAHEQGMIHRDVKPGNIVVEETDRGIRATLTDFGLAKAAGGGSVLTSQGTLLGSPEYMAPEQADPERAADVGPAADRYALGIIAYQLLTGRVPFPGNTPATLNAHEHKPVPPPRSFRPGLPMAVEEALLKMLAKAPEDRFSSACVFVGELQDATLTEERDALLEPLYERLRSAAARGDWSEVLALGGHIQAVAPDYRDLPRWMAQARQRLRRPRIPTLPTWAWAAGGVVLTLLAVTLFTQGFGLWGEPGPTDVPPVNASLGDTRTRLADKMMMVYVPGGTFPMGSDEDDLEYAVQLCDEYSYCERRWFDDEQRVHDVTLDGFWIDRTEVTNAQHVRCVADGDCEESRWAVDAHLGRDDNPVVGVSWNDAAAYCEWAGARLPTEAEWEYAARGPEGHIFPWGDDDLTCDLAQYRDCSGQTVPAGRLPDGASWCGALDMAGNVWEWVADWYESDYYERSASENPVGPEGKILKVVRGGGWGSNPYFVRCANRNGISRGVGRSSTGFRCARDS